MTRNNKIVLGIFIVCGLVVIGIITGVSIFFHKYSKYDMKMGEAPDLYIVYGANLGTSPVPGITSTNVNPNAQGGDALPYQNAKSVEGIFTLILPNDNLTDIHFSTQNIAGLLLSKEAFDAYEIGDTDVKKVFLPSFKAAILNTKMIALLYHSAKQAEGKKNNAFNKFEAFKKENGVAPNAAIRIAYSNLSCVDYVPANISYEEIGKIFGLSNK